MHSATARSPVADESVYALGPLAMGCHTTDSVSYYEYHLSLLIMRIERNTCTHALMSFCTGRCTSEIALDSTMSLPVSAQSHVVLH